VNEDGKVRLGGSSVRVSPLGVGTNAWGHGGRPRPELRPVLEAALLRGIVFFDTAEIYGGGGSERTLGVLLGGSPQVGERPVILSKFFPMPWRLRKRQLIEALRRSLDRLVMPSLDVYLIHFPLGPVNAWLDALAHVAGAGLVRAVGVSNFNARQLRHAHRALASRGIPLACNEVELSLARRGAERNGTLAACQELGVTVIAYRPLALGRLVQSPTRSSHGWRRLVAAGMRTGDRLTDVLQEIGRSHGEKTPAQVALNWVFCKGALPIPGATRVAHLEENAGALGWRLTDAEVAALDAAS